MNKQIISRRIIIIAGLTLLSLVLMSVAVSVYNNQKNSFGDEIAIVGLKDETSGREKPSDKELIDYIQSELLKIVNMNSDEQKEGRDIKDAIIREGSFNQTHNKDEGVYIVSFIVDIESLSQSYQANYQWKTSDGSDEHLDEWGDNVRCLPSDKLIYGDFDCQDMFTVMGGSEKSIINHLPHSSLNYRITYSPSQDNVLDVTIETTASDERIDADAAISAYKQEVLEWIRSVGFDPQDFYINYTYVRASIY